MYVPEGTLTPASRSKACVEVCLMGPEHQKRMAYQITFSPVVCIGSLPKMLKISAIDVVDRARKLEPASPARSTLNWCVPLALVLLCRWQRVLGVVQGCHRV